MLNIKETHFMIHLLTLNILASSLQANFEFVSIAILKFSSFKESGLPDCILKALISQGSHSSRLLKQTFGINFEQFFPLLHFPQIPYKYFDALEPSLNSYNKYV